MTTAIVAGTAVHIDAVAAQLRACGFDTIVIDGDRGVAGTAAGLTPGSIDCYVHVASTPAEAARGWDPQVLAALSPAAGSNGAVGPGIPGSVPLSLLAGVAPELGYADWRDEIMGATSSPRSYLGWTTPDGRQRAVVLSGAVLSPLPEPAAGAPALSWGEPGPGVVALAETILADALRMPDPVRPGTSVSELAAELSEAFAKEVLMHLPPDGFELSAAEVAGWGRQHLCRDEPQLVAAGALAVT